MTGKMKWTLAKNKSGNSFLQKVMQVDKANYLTAVKYNKLGDTMLLHLI
jgi:hypothetical protein